MRCPSTLKKVDVGSHGLIYWCECVKCGELRRYTSLRGNNTYMCYDCLAKERKAKAEEKSKKEKQKIHSEAQKIAEMYVKSLINIVKTTPSAADVVTDRNNLVKALENYKLTFFEEDKQ